MLPRIIELFLYDNSLFVKDNCAHALTPFIRSKDGTTSRFFFLTELTFLACVYFEGKASALFEGTSFLHLLILLSQIVVYMKVIDELQEDSLVVALESLLIEYADQLQLTTNASAVLKKFVCRVF